MSDKIICTCLDLSEDDIIKAIKNGADTLEKIQEATEAGTICGACIPEIEELIEQYK